MLKSAKLLLAAGLLASTSGTVVAQSGLPNLGTPTVTQAADLAQQARSAHPGIFGCSATGSKQIIGAAGGGLLGGIVGNRVAGGNRTIGTVVGTAVGAAAGSWIGCKLQINDRRKAEAALARAAQENSAQRWASADTGASGTATPLSMAGLSGISFPAGLAPVQSFDDRAGGFVSSGRINLRASPSVSSEILGTLAPGEPVEAVAGVAGQPWLLLAQNGVARGYVSEPLLTKSTAPGGNGCRMIRQTIQTKDAAPASQDFKACPDANGGWNLTPA